MPEKTITYVNGYCKAVSTQYGEIINFQVNPSDLNLLPKDEKGFVKISMMRLKEPGKYGQTHYMKLNDYQKPEGGQSSIPKTSKVENDLPF